MSNTVDPQDQIIYNSRYFQRNFDDYTASQPMLYLTRILNYLLRSYVSKDTNYSARIYGCDPYVSQIGSGANGHYIKFVISPGKLILDSTLIHIPTSFSLDVNTAGFLDYDEIVIMAGFKYGTVTKVTAPKCPITGIDQKDASVKAKFQVVMRNSTNNTAVTLTPPLIISENLTSIVLGRFKIIRVSHIKPFLSSSESASLFTNVLDTKIIRIYHPYGVSTISLYTDWIKSLTTDITLSTTRFYNTIVQATTNQAYLNYNKLHTSLKLYTPFIMNNSTYSIAKPLIMNIHTQEMLHSYTENYMSSNRFNIEDLVRYSPTFDRNFIHGV